MFEQLLKDFEASAGSAIDGWAWLSGKAGAVVVDETVGLTRTRPYPWSTFKPYTSWRGLFDRTYLARHLPPADLQSLPDVAKVIQLFARPAGQPAKLSAKSTCLFPAFAQYLTDGFIRTGVPRKSIHDTSPIDPTRTSSNHEIDLCQLYGRNAVQTDALRLKDGTFGRRGRLKSQFVTINGTAEEFPPFLFPGGQEPSDPQFDALDPPLLALPPQPLPPLGTIFAVGGDRVNTTPFSAMMNTLLLREHNRIAHELETQNPGPDWDDDRVFETARNIMIPIFITIVIEQYINHITPLPFSLRADPTVAYTANWNRPNWITAEFSLLYRWHPLMPDSIDWPTGPIPLGDFQVNNQPLLDVGLDAAFSAAARQQAGELGAFNTAAALLPIENLSLKQGRVYRLDTYNHYRVAFGMKAAERFEDISSDPSVRALLQQLYGTPDDVEFYPGLFAEDRVPESPLPGLLMRMVAVDAFSQALTNPLLSQWVFNAETFTQWGYDLIQNTSKLGDILARNVPVRGTTPIEMTQATWHYANGP